MLNTSDLKRKLESAFSEDQVTTLTEVLLEYQAGLATSVDMQDLKDAVKVLTEAQARTETRMEELAEAQARTEKRMEELAEAQARTEKQVKELTEAQARTETRMEELAEAQARTEKRMEELAVVQTRTEERLGYLTEAQTRTEETLNKLVLDHDNTRKQLGGLSNTVGYTLENAAYRTLPALLETDYDIIVQDKLTRTYLRDNRGRSVEVNIFGRGNKNGRDVIILGESKSQLSANHIDHFISNRLAHLKPLYENVFPLLITHMTSSENVEAYAKERGIALYYSYQL